MKDSSNNRIRLDKWLKIARIFKTRTQASHACEERRVKVNGEVAKSAKTIKIGDKIAVKFNQRYRELEVLGISFKSVSIKEARELFREVSNQVITEEEMGLAKGLERPKLAKSFKYSGRPTKKERRSLIKIRGY